MKTTIALEAQTDADEKLLNQLGENMINSMVLKAGHSVIMRVLAHLKHLDAGPSCPTPEGNALVVLRVKVEADKIPLRRFYHAVAELIDHPSPLDGLGGREISHWLPGDMSFPFMWLYAGDDDQGSDFHRASLEHQQMFMALANEVMYGPDRDDDMLADAWWWSRDDVNI